MVLFGKIERDLEIKSEAHLFHDVFGNRPHHVSNVTPHHIQGCDLHEGDWGVAGSVIYWNYVHDGKASVAKELIESIDHENNSTTFKVIEGDLLELYKDFRLIVQATPKEGGGSLVHWTMEYEKLHADVPQPETLMEFAINVSKDIDGHLQDAKKMTLSGKIFGETEIKSSAEKFHDVFGSRPHHVSNITPEKVQACDLHEGEFGTAGSTIAWSYVHEGKAKVAKQIIEVIDDENNLTRFKMIEGDLMEEYKSFIITVQATPKERGTGSVVRWTLEFEKLNEDVPEPKSMLEYFDHITKDIDAHLQEQA